MIQLAITNQRLAKLNEGYIARRRTSKRLSSGASGAAEAQQHRGSIMTSVAHKSQVLEPVDVTTANFEYFEATRTRTKRHSVEWRLPLYLDLGITNTTEIREISLSAENEICQFYRNKQQ